MQRYGNRIQIITYVPVEIFEQFEISRGRESRSSFLAGIIERAYGDGSSVKIS